MILGLDGQDKGSMAGVKKDFRADEFMLEQNWKNVGNVHRGWGEAGGQGLGRKAR